MARYWVGDTGERAAPDPDRSGAPQGPQARTPERERFADAVRRTLAGNVRTDEAE